MPQQTSSFKNRARTLPPHAFSNHHVTLSAAANKSPLPSPVEHAIKQWLESPLLNTSHAPLPDICQCCGQNNCENLKSLSKMIADLDSGSRLAAEIGQVLLQNNKDCSLESIQLKKQLDDALEEVYHMNQELQRRTWEFEKIQKILDETTADLDMTNAKCAELSKALQAKTSECAELSTYRFLVRHSEEREEILRNKLDDTNQELAMARKNELSWEGKYCKLKVRYDNLYEKLRQSSQDERKSFNCAAGTLVQYNNQSTLEQRARRAKLDLTQWSQLNAEKTDSKELIVFVKDLAAANAKLKMELLNCKDRVSMLQSEQQSHMEQDELAEWPNDVYDLGVDRPKQRHIVPHSSVKPKLRRSLSAKESKSSAPQKQQDSMFTKCRGSPPTPVVSASTPSGIPKDPIVHHHYHYYVQHHKNKPTKRPSSNAASLSHLSNPPTPEESNSSDARDLWTHATYTSTHEQRPYHQLCSYVTHVLQRLRATEIRALNRRLRRTFDIDELSSMSNSIIDNLLTDIGALKSRFLWVEGQKIVDGLQDFFPLLGVLQDLLQEVGQLRMTVNDLQAEYVRKVEIMGARIEQDIARKQQEQKLQQRDNGSQSPFLGRSWVAQLFQSTRSTATAANTSYSMLHGEKTISRMFQRPHRYQQGSSSRISSDAVDRHGPPSSFPRLSDQQSMAYPPLMKISRSTGTDCPRPKLPPLQQMKQHRRLLTPPANLSGLSPSLASDMDIDWKLRGPGFRETWLG
ncbi:uncharacterized protein BYT42DRAFT_580033 [Radiomyces spectabilis]|uniref:uncharacterized protein n=1 Tax=Radiomyces spectabilis TaxID=64574 RepID=UPI00221EC160|nr:uncharacterized protein BYT42DRAFT_580033 [Radiomyces spectabilis]KAI8371378.1 hypothetical protein BYT42DRAFT_580033 [Radiomyces spectabilis]